MRTREDIEVRGGGGDGWAILRAVRLAALLDSPGAFWSTYEETVAHDEPWWRAWPRQGAALIAWQAGQPVGMVGVARPGSEALPGDLFAMWVAPAARGSGAADALIEAAVAWAAAAGLPGLGLAVAPGNARAERVYARHGFVVTDEPAMAAGGLTMRLRFPVVTSSPAPAGPRP